MCDTETSKPRLEKRVPFDIVYAQLNHVLQMIISKKTFRLMCM